MWVELMLALLGERWSANIAAVDGNRVVGLEWQAVRKCMFTLWLEKPMTGASARSTIDVLARHVGAYCDLSTAQLYDVFPSENNESPS